MQFIGPDLIRIGCWAGVHRSSTEHYPRLNGDRRVSGVEDPILNTYAEAAGMKYEKGIGRHLAGVIKEMVETGRATEAIREHKETTKPGAYAVVQEAKRFHATPKAEKKRCH